MCKSPAMVPSPAFASVKRCGGSVTLTQTRTAATRAAVNSKTFFNAFVARYSLLAARRWQLDR
jgi:hypothetical protein